MTCGSCVSRIDKALRTVDAVTDAKVNLATETATIELAYSEDFTKDLIRAVRAAGYDAEPYKFASADRTLGSAMRSVGEVMGIGRTFQEAMLKAISSLEGGYPDVADRTDEQIRLSMSSLPPTRYTS